jgi:DNA (cytosine-5)-methyltransferase 1
MEDQMRTGPYEVLHWLDQLYVAAVVIENVPEFTDWGPLNANGRPNKRLRGALFRQFIENLKALGYRVDWRILNAADYGDATSRRRLFIIARRKGLIAWPEPTHEPRAGRTQPRLFGSTLTYRSALEIIDHSIKGISIFNRVRPLEGKTVKRIMAGFYRYGLPAILKASNETAIFNMNRDMRTSPASRPMPTIAANSVFGMAEYSVVHMSRDHDATPASKPLPTLTSRNNFGLAEYAVVQLNQHCDSHSIDDPLPRIAAGGGHLGLAEFVIGQHSGSVARPVDEPLPTIAADGAIGLVQPIAFGRAESYEGWTVGQPYLVSYYGTGQALSIDEPLDTVTSKPRFALCVPLSKGSQSDRLYVDILYRMLQPHELAAAMSFPSTYTFTSGRPVRPARRTYQPRPQFANITSEEAVRMIGNAWPGETGYRVSLAAIS